MPWLKILFLLLLPCLVVDFRHSAIAQSRAIVLAVLEFISIMFSHFGHMPRKQLVGVIVIAIGLWIGSLFYRWIFDLTNYIVVLTICTFYYNLWSEFARDYYTNSKYFASIVWCLVVVMNDWKLTVDAFNTGEIWWTLLYNIWLHILLGAILALHNVWVKYCELNRVSWKYLFKWQHYVSELYLDELWTLLFITIYVPTTRLKAFIK